MSKIVFFCIPAHGHTNPTLGVVRELVERGHQVYYYSYNSFREKIEAVGATFVSCDDYDIEQNLDPRDAFTDKYAFVGPSVRPASSQIKKEKEKLIYISMGTVNNDMMKFYKNCMLAFADTDYQVVMSVGNLVDIASLGTVPENISVSCHVDQIAVLEKADVFLSHCGMNSVNESLYYQVPLVMYPQTSEQGGVATRVS